MDYTLTKTDKLSSIIVRYSDITDMDCIVDEEIPLEHYLQRLFQTKEDMYDYLYMDDDEIDLPSNTTEEEVNQYYHKYVELGRRYYLYGDKGDGQLSL